MDSEGTGSSSGDRSGTAVEAERAGALVAPIGNSEEILIHWSPPQTKTNLLFIRASGSANYPYWTIPAAWRTYDIAISYYDVDPAPVPGFRGAEYFVSGGLSKFHAFQLLYEKCESLRDYAAVMLLDDDIEIETSAIDQYFPFHLEQRLALSQPSLTHDSQHTWPITLCCPSFKLRLTNFVEVMAPCFSRDALARVVETFSQSISGWGLEFAWGKILEDERIGIVDAVTMRHARPMDVVNGAFYRYLAARGINPFEETRKVCEAYHVGKFEMRVLSALQNREYLDFNLAEFLK